MHIYIIGLMVTFHESCSFAIHSCASMAILDAVPFLLMYRIVERGNVAFHVPGVPFRSNTFPWNSTVGAIDSEVVGARAIPRSRPRVLSQHSCSRGRPRETTRCL